jgi:hypothetical protein
MRLDRSDSRWSKPSVLDGKLLALGGEAAASNSRARLDLSHSARELAELPAGLKLQGLNLRGCIRLTRLPDDLEVQHLDLGGCTGLRSLPDGLRCYELSLKGTRIASLPVGLRVDYRLDLEGCTELTELPRGLRVGSLVLRGCTGLTALPEGLDVQFLELQGCSRLVGWPEGARVRMGHLNLRGCRRLAALPESMGRERLSQLDISDCTALTCLPEGLEVGSWIEMARSGVTALPRSLAGARLRWNGVTIDHRIAFRPETIAVDEVLSEPNAELRRVLLERYGLERFLRDADAEVLDEDRDPGGVRTLFRVALEGDEDLVCVMVHCPSTGGRYLLRVPPTMTNCHQAVAWTAGYDDPSLYRPMVEA